MTPQCIALESGRRCARASAVGAVFCDEHMKAPAGRRGGWISAWKRKINMAPSPKGTQYESSGYTDFHNVAPPHSSMPLYVGSQPPFDRELAFDVLVLCAKELQPERLGFRGQVLRCPMEDDALSTEQIKSAIVTSSQVADCLAMRKKVLVTCRAGLNRSALIAGLVLARMTRMSQQQIVDHLRSRRDPNCLFNPHFRVYIARFIEGTRNADRRG